MLDDATLNALLAALPATRDDRESLVDAIGAIPSDACVRGMIVKQLPAAMGPEDTRAFRAWAEPMGRYGAFSWVPVSWFVLGTARLATLQYPERDEPLLDACHRYQAETLPTTLESTILRAMVRACSGHLGEFLEVSVRGAASYFNHGDMYVEHTTDGRVAVHADGHHASAEAYYVPGYYDGIVRYFGATASRFEILGPTRWTVTIDC